MMAWLQLLKIYSSCFRTTSECWPRVLKFRAVYRLVPLALILSHVFQNSATILSHAAIIWKICTYILYGKTLRVASPSCVFRFRMSTILKKEGFKVNIKNYDSEDKVDLVVDGVNKILDRVVSS